MPLQTLDVVWIHDECIRPPGPKMLVCITPEQGLYFRINTRGHWQHSIPLAQRDHPNVLSHDSHLECGQPIELDDYLVDQALARHG